MVALGELRKGIEGVQDDARKLALSDWLHTELAMFFWAAC